MNLLIEVERFGWTDYEVSYTEQTFNPIIAFEDYMQTLDWFERTYGKNYDEVARDNDVLLIKWKMKFGEKTPEAYFIIVNFELGTQFIIDEVEQLW